MKNYKSLTLLAFISLCILFYSCDKYQILKSEDADPVSAGANLKEMSLWAFLKAHNQNTDLTNVSLFAEAIERAGLINMLDHAGDYTVILPSNKAIPGLLTAVGYTTLADVPPVVLKNIILNNIFQGRVHSYDLAVNENQKYVTLNGDSVYLQRENPYVLNVNKIATQASGTAKVRTRDLQFNNAVAHVVDVFTYYKPLKSTKDAKPSGLVVSTEKINISKDSYVTYGANENINYNNTTELFAKFNIELNNVGTRRTFLQYQVKNPGFSGRIGSVELFLYCHRIDVPAGGKPLTVNFYRDEDVDWTETTLTAKNAPASGTSVVGSFTVPNAGNNKWYSADITTAYVASLSENKSFINIGAYTPDAYIVGFRPRENGTGANKSYLLLSSPPATIFTSATVNTLNVDHNLAIKSVTGAELQVAGDADKNTSYFITSMPQGGYLALNGQLLSLNSTFTQEEVNKGAVKYFYTGSAASATDSFSVEVKDFRGGYYPDILTVPVKIN